MYVSKNKLYAAYRVAGNWRIHKRLPRLAALAKKIFKEIDAPK